MDRMTRSCARGVQRAEVQPEGMVTASARRRGITMTISRRTEPVGPGQPAASMDLSRSAIARYIQLATLFRRRIPSGQWKLHDQIPTVEDLVEECGVARATVRQALGVLEKEGLIERFRAKGTFVTKRP